MPAGYLTPPVDFVTYFVTDRQTDRQTDRRTDEFKGALGLLLKTCPKHVGPNLVFADDDKQRSRRGRLVGLLLSPAGYLTPPVDFVTFFVTVFLKMFGIFRSKFFF